MTFENPFGCQDKSCPVGVTWHCVFCILAEEYYEAKNEGGIIRV